MMHRVICGIMAAAVLSGCLLSPGCSGGAGRGGRGNALGIEKIEGLPEDFILGMDVSSVIAEEKSGVKYYDFDGNEQDVLKTLAENGVNTVRARVWNDPFDELGRGFGGGNCDIGAAVEIGVRAAKYGLGMIVDFHLSDFWADPGKQKAPRAWQGMDAEEKAGAVYAYVKDCLERLVSAGAKIRMVQIGNETNGALCGETEWPDICALMNAGVRAVREVCPGALAAVHFTNPEKKGSYTRYASELARYEVDYDVFASSYYPYWHGSLEGLSAELGAVAENYGKKVMVMETSYAYTLEDSDFHGNTVNSGSGLPLPYPVSEEGQARLVHDVIETVAGIPNGIGAVYWEGAWIGVGGSSWEENRAIWESCGSGWASSYAACYDPEDAGRWYGGCAVENQTMFDKNGRPLESLSVFALVRGGR